MTRKDEALFQARLARHIDELRWLYKENHLDGSIPVSHIGGCYGYGMGQSHRINYNVTFDS